MKVIHKFLVLSVALMAFPALAADESGLAISKGLAIIGAGLAGLGAAIGIGLLAGRLLEAIARQPELESKLMGRFFLAVGLTDAVPVIVIAFSLIILFG
jgi:F-type H+-transporting ATPase subunit c